MKTLNIYSDGRDPFQDYPIGHSTAMIMQHGMTYDRCVTFVYDGKVRTVEVHAIGVSAKDNSLVMRGYQVAGQASRPLPQWTLFSLNKVEGIAIANVASGAPREGYTLDDKQMTPVLCQLAI